MTLSRPDFDFSKYVEVPDAWIENALKIPDTVKNQPKALPIRRYVTAASIVLVIALGISVYFLFGNKSPISIAPTPKTDNTESVTPSPSFSEIPTEAESQTDSTLPQGIKREAETQLSTDAQGHAIIISAPPVTRDSNATTPPKADASAQKPTDAVLPPRETSPGNVIVKPAAPTQPNVPPTTPPATEPTPTPAHDEEPQTTAPAPSTADPPVEQPTEDDPPYELPTEVWYDPPTETPSEIVLTATIPDAILRQGSPIYCRIHLSNGMPVGEWELYSDLHRAAVYGSTAVYEPLASGLNLSHGKYNYYFYDSTGKTFAKGTFHID